MIDARCGN